MKTAIIALAALACLLSVTDAKSVSPYRESIQLETTPTVPATPLTPEQKKAAEKQAQLIIWIVVGVCCCCCVLPACIYGCVICGLIGAAATAGSGSHSDEGGEREATFDEERILNSKTHVAPLLA